jgi:UDP-glucose 4-epimerase
LGTGRETSVNAVVDLMRQVVGETRFPPVRYALARPGEVRRNFVDIARARKYLDFHPTTDLLTGLKKTWQWFQENLTGPG